MFKPRPKPITPAIGQESVWDYPRPPRLEDSRHHIEIIFNGITIAQTTRAKRILETASPPVYYISPQDIQMQYLYPNMQKSWCEWKGAAIYHDLIVDDKTATQVAWSYPTPNPSYQAIAGWLGFYPGRVDQCLLDGEQVRPQPGHFYGGWITNDIVGPFKGEPGTGHW